MNRRGFLSSILALGAAPAIVRADSLMRIVPRETTVFWGKGMPQLMREAQAASGPWKVMWVNCRAEVWRTDWSVRLESVTDAELCATLQTNPAVVISYWRDQ